MNTGTSAPRRSPSSASSCRLRSKLPDAVQRQEHRRGIGAAAPQSTAHGQPLLHPDLHPASDLRFLLQQLRGLDADVLVRGDAEHAVHAPDATVLARAKLQHVAVIDEAEDRLQQMVAVGAASRHAQEEIELARGRVGDGGFVHVGVAREAARIRGRAPL